VVVDVVVDLDVNGDGDVNADDLDGRGTTRDLVARDDEGRGYPSQAFVPWCLRVMLSREPLDLGASAARYV
jgi:hypothetical protein